MTQLKPGLKLQSAVCDAEIMVIKAPGEAQLTCGGVAMLAAGETPEPGLEPDAGHLNGCQVGKRYVNDDQSLEVLCVKAGEGSLAADGAPLQTKESKKLPSSD